MSLDHELYARFYISNKAKGKHDPDGCPVDIPLSADPYCGIRHFEDVTYVVKTVLSWCGNQGVLEFFRDHVEGGLPGGCDGIARVDIGTIVDLRDELMKIANGKKSVLTEEYDSYVDDDGKPCKEWAKQDAEILDRYIHIGQHVSYIYSYGC